MMTATSDYLARLDVALRDVPHGVAAEIRAGIAEELQSLDADAAEARIAQLGDPAVIAREALDPDGYTPPPAPAAPRPEVIASPAPLPVSHSRGFAIAAALTLSFGGYLVPVVGWFVGVALVLLSSMWRTWEKLVAILVPVVLFGGLMLFSFAAFTTTGAVEVHEASGTGTPPEVENPLVPNLLLAGPHFLIIIAVAVVIPLSGLWLLWRMRGRSAS
ncbi:HAAS signaling domain-containing protein [Microbacterium arabinogalactanolyticum]|uniref:HAAS signaling domain-containing protein n=1 Tax=Microbacterium arabinogalactanolyticum TaxID=69365 RepID=UPI0040439902